MTDNNHPITPPEELVRLWCYEDGDEIRTSPRWYQRLCAKSARWGADQELDACCEWLDFNYPYVCITMLRADRRPEPPSLKEQALQALDQADKGLSESEWQQRSDTIRRALNALPDDLN